MIFECIDLLQTAFSYQVKTALRKRHFRTNLKHDPTTAVKMSQHNANTAFFAFLERKRVNNLLKKADSYQ